MTTPPGPIDPVPARALHVVIDMQRVFHESTPWHAPDLARALPQVLRLVEARPAQALFARFITPQTSEAAPGRWAKYYERWSAVTLGNMPEALLDVVPVLSRHATSSRIVDKPGYSVFQSPDFRRHLQDRPTDTLILSGVETDICILASAFDAVDRGYRVVIPIDAVASSSRAAHEAVLKYVLPRLAEQVDLVTTDDLLRLWPEDTLSSG